MRSIKRTTPRLHKKPEGERAAKTLKQLLPAHSGFIPDEQFLAAQDLMIRTGKKVAKTMFGLEGAGFVFLAGFPRSKYPVVCQLEKKHKLTKVFIREGSDPGESLTDVNEHNLFCFLSGMVPRRLHDEWVLEIVAQAALLSDADKRSVVDRARQRLTPSDKSRLQITYLGGLLTKEKERLARLMLMHVAQ